MSRRANPLSCPACGGQANRVIDSRVGRTEVRRRRRCCACAQRWTTYERAEDATHARATAQLRGAFESIKRTVDGVAAALTESR